jgi:hypothetical protein
MTALGKTHLEGSTAACRQVRSLPAVQMYGNPRDYATDGVAEYERSSEMDELVNQITQRTGISADQARQAVQVVADYLKAKLPAPLAGQVGTVLSGNTLGDSASQAGQMLGSLFGDKS